MAASALVEGEEAGTDDADVGGCEGEVFVEADFEDLTLSQLKSRDGISCIRMRCLLSDTLTILLIFCFFMSATS